MVCLHAGVDFFLLQWCSLKNNQHKWTAGVYLLIRSSPLIEYSSTILLLALWLGAITTVFSSLIGLFQQDIKKVIAYSTMSQVARDCKTHYIAVRHQTICESPFLGFSKRLITTNILRLGSQAKGYSSLKGVCADLSTDNIILNPYYITGFTDAENCFLINIHKRQKSGYNVSLSFKIKLHSKDKEFLEKIFNFFNVTLAKKSFIFQTYVSYADSRSSLGNSGAVGTKKKKRINKSLISNVQKRTYVTQNCNTAQDHFCVENPAAKPSDFNEWLSGLIDGDGEFFVSKKGYANFKIVMKKEDKLALYSIKHKFGGSIKKISSGLKYKLAHKKGLIKLVNSVNGLIRNPLRMLQLDKVCKLYGIKFEISKPLTYYNGWFSGFIDSDGLIYYNEKSDQLILSVTQKNKFLLDSLFNLYSGVIEITDSREAFQYSIFRKQEVLNIINNYLKRYPLMSNKRKKIDLIKKLYEVESGSVEKLLLIAKINNK